MAGRDDTDDPMTIAPESGISAEQAMESWSESQTTEASIRLLLPENAQRPPAMRQITGPGAPRDLVLTRERMTVGRSKAADFTVDSPELSRLHVEIQCDGREYCARDLDSRNGIYLNGLRVHSAVLHHGDAVQIGNVTLIFNEAG